MNPQWRSEAVVALCRRMLDLRVYDALPIVADALQEAGCTDEALLAQCQSPDLDRVAAERLANLLFSEETAAAVAWLERVGREFNYEYPEDVEPTMNDYTIALAAGHDGVKEGHMSFGTVSGADFFRDSEENMRDFFRNWSLVTGVEVPEEIQANLSVSCAC